MTLASLNTKDVGEVLSSIREQMSDPTLASTDTPTNSSDVLILNQPLEDEVSSFTDNKENNNPEEETTMAKTSTTVQDETLDITPQETATATDENSEEIAHKEAISEVEDIFTPDNPTDTFQTDPSSFVDQRGTDGGNAGRSSAPQGSTQENIMSPEAISESGKAFSELSGMINHIHKQTTATLGNIEPFSVETAGNYTLDTLMRELLKPMLKDWLDAHLPSLVKWLVAEQIEKMLLANGIETGKGNGITSPNTGTSTNTNTPEDANNAQG